MPRERVRLGAGGRVVIPSKYREALSLAEGDELVLVLEDASLRLMKTEEAVRRAQDLVDRYVPRNLDLAAELLSQRKQES